MDGVAGERDRESGGGRLKNNRSKFQNLLTSCGILNLVCCINLNWLSLAGVLIEKDGVLGVSVLICSYNEIVGIDVSCLQQSES